MDNKLLEQGKKLVNELNKAADAYYNGTEYITDKEYDAKFDQLKEIEVKIGEVFLDSPTLRAGYVVKSSLEKVTHEYPTLSLDKTKDADLLVNWLADQKGILSWKLDGLTYTKNKTCKKAKKEALYIERTGKCCFCSWNRKEKKSIAKKYRNTRGLSFASKKI